MSLFYCGFSTWEIADGLISLELNDTLVLLFMLTGINGFYSIISLTCENSETSDSFSLPILFLIGIVDDLFVTSI